MYDSEFEDYFQLTTHLDSVFLGYSRQSKSHNQFLKIPT